MVSYKRVIIMMNYFRQTGVLSNTKSVQSQGKDKWMRLVGAEEHRKNLQGRSEAQSRKTK